MSGHGRTITVDELGPAKVIQVREPGLGLDAVLVVDNVACGPSIGGLRMARDVSIEECARLARAMTLKNAAAGLPHGGGKSVLFGDPHMPADSERSARARVRVRAGRSCDYIFGPDMGTDETCMAWVHDEIGRAVGLPRELGGIPLDELGATGFGILHAAEVARALDRARAARRARRRAGLRLGRAARRAFPRRARGPAGGSLGLAGAIHDPDGLDVGALRALKASGRSVVEYERAEPLSGDDLLGVDCDVWIPAARPDVIREDNCGRLRAKLVVSGANIAITPGAEAILHGRGSSCIPDFIANAGGVICAALEYRGATQAAAFAAIEEKIRSNTEAVLEAAPRDQVAPRQAAVALATAQVKRAMTYRRFSIL